ncbi:MAG: enoyl-CoA hydratase/isomerase family protein [SAR202 cluster bacterium]|nr:enoyl-CoA hydratase/isomerase family protein [SAR202 cluster bacterium]
MNEAVLYRREGPVAVITLNRPEALNAINRQLKEGLASALRRLDEDTEALVGIVTGSGRAFCAGRDLKERAADNAAGVQPKSTDSLLPDSPHMWRRPAKPLIAAINGFALAGGWAIAQLCDLRVASSEAKLGITEARVGLLPPFAASLPKTMPLAQVLELVWTAEAVPAQRAYEMGFVNCVVEPSRVMEEAMSLALKVAENAPLSVRYFKEMAYAGLEMDDVGLASLIHARYESLLGSEDAVEGPRAFVEKRKPRWKGR